MVRVPCATTYFMAKLALSMIFKVDYPVFFTVYSCDDIDLLTKEHILMFVARGSRADVVVGPRSVKCPEPNFCLISFGHYTARLSACC